MMPRQPLERGPSTPHRVTHIVLDESRPTLVEPPYALTRAYDQIATGFGAIASNVIYQEGIGWRLKSNQDDRASKRQTEAGNAGILTDADFDVADHHGFLSSFVKDPDGTFSAFVIDEGDKFLTKQIPAGEDPAANLAADQATIPPPFPEEDPEPMDRVAVSTFAAARHKRNFLFEIQVTANTPDVRGPIATFYFPGPPNFGRAYSGSGYYAVKVFGFAQAFLYEYQWLNDAWQWVFLGSFGGDAIHPTGSRWWIRVEIIESKTSRYPFGGLVITSNLISTRSQSQAANEGKANGYLAVHAGTSAATQKVPEGFYAWQCSYSDGAPVPASPPGDGSKVRIDTNRNMRVPTQVSKQTFETSGYLVDGNFKLPFLASDDEPIRIAWYGQLPTGTSITPRLFRGDTDGEITADATYDFLAEFTPVAGLADYYARFDFAGVSDASPVLQGVIYKRDGIYIDVTPGEFELEIGPEVTDVDEDGAPLAGSLAEAIPDSRMEIIQPGSDPSIAVATFGVHDLTRIHDRITKRGMFTSRIETEYDPVDSEQRCILHRGYVIQPQGYYRGKGYTGDRTTGSPGYASGRVFWSLSSAGMWDKLNRALSPCRWDWGASDPEAAANPDGSQPSYKATDAIRVMLQWAKFPQSMIDIPDIPLRLYASNGVDFYVEPLSSLSDMIMRIVRKYLGMRLVFCENSGTYGQWRLLSPTQAPYTPLLHFTTEPQPSGTLSHQLSSYPAIGGRPVVPVIGGTLAPFNIPLEANRIIVTASGYIGGAKGSQARFTQVWHNFKSFNFLRLADTHPNYPDPLHPDWCPDILEAAYIDPGLVDREGTGKWVNYAIRRIASIAGHTIRGVRFDAPLPLIDVPGDESLAGKVRMPRYYDPCTLDGVTYLVRECNPYYTKDGHQRARFEIEAPREDYL